MLIDEALQQALDNLNEILVPGKYAKKMSDSMANIQSVISVVQNASEKHSILSVKYDLTIIISLNEPKR